MRQSNFELCRICSMLLIVLLHTTFVSFSWPEDTTINWFITVFSSFAIVGVDVFILLSGFFSVKYKNLSFINLLFICFFACVANAIICLVSGQSLTINNLFFISQSNWYVIMYIGLLAFAPVLNKFVDTANKREFLIVIIALLIYNVYFEFFPRRGICSPQFHWGLSLIWFLVAYLIGRYIKIYDVPAHWKRYAIFYYLLTVVILIFSQIVLIKSNHPELVQYFLGQNNPIVLFGAISFLLIFSHFSFQSRIVNRIASSTLMVLLIHNSSIVMPITSKWFRYLYGSDFNTFTTIVLWLCLVLLIYICCTLIDQLRIEIFRVITKEYR